jgi:outer membrane receptor for ferrienterochelin and colicins
MTRFFTILLLLLAAFQTKAANLVIEVRDSQTKENLPSAKISYEYGTTKKHATTNAYGKVELKEIGYPLTISCSYVGFENFTQTITEKEAGQKAEKKGHFTFFLKTKYTSINDIVITGQSAPVLATQSIYKVNTISATQIGQRGAANLNEVLNYETNNFVSNDNILGSSVNIGGVGGQNVKILINGIPLTGRENGNIDLGQINLPNIKKVEMIQGPMSVMYGSNALGGVINLITATTQKPYTISVKSYLESIGRYNLSGNFSLNKNKHSLQLSFARNFFQGWTPKDSIDRYQLWKPKTQYLSDLQYTYDFKKVKLTYFSSLLNEKITNKGTPIVNPYEGYAFDEYYRTHRFINSLGANIKLSEKENLSFANSFTNYKRTKNRFKKDLVSLDQYETKNVGDQDTSIFNNWNLRGTFTSTRFKNIDFLGGYEYSFEKANSFKLADQTQQIGEIGLFASFLFKYKIINFQPSVRYTNNSKFAKAISPAIHSKIEISKNTQLRASFARGFRAPTLKEMYLQFVDQNHTIIGNADLKPEIGDHLEVGITHTRKLNKLTAQYGLTGYYNAIQNLITLAVYNGQGVLRVYDNLDHYRNFIAIGQAKLDFKKMSVQQSLGFTHVLASVVVPKHTIYEVSTTISYKNDYLKTTFNFNYKFNSKQPVLTIDDKYLFTSPIHIGNFSMQRSFFKNYLQAQVGIKNLFNIQNARLNGATDVQGSAHTSSNGMQLFPARSLFFNFIYSL